MIDDPIQPSSISLLFPLMLLVALIATFASIGTFGPYFGRRNLCFIRTRKLHPLGVPACTAAVDSGTRIFSELEVPLDLTLVGCSSFLSISNHPLTDGVFGSLISTTSTG